MPLFNSQHQNDRGIRWRGIAATAMVELLVLFALSFAVVRYVEWSSAANQAEFMMRSERVELLTPSGSAGQHSLHDLILERHAPSAMDKRVRLMRLSAAGKRIVGVMVRAAG
jgi:hypothetical protein